VIGTTVIENRNLLSAELGVSPHRYLPSIPNLPYQYALYTNFEAAALDCANAEVPLDPDELLSSEAAERAEGAAAARDTEPPVRGGGGGGGAAYD